MVLRSVFRFGVVFYDNFNGQIRASVFTLPAAYAVCGARCICFFIFIEFQDIFGTEMNADAAAFTPFFVYNDFLQYRFGHGPVPFRIFGCIILYKNP